MSDCFDHAGDADQQSLGMHHTCHTHVQEITTMSIQRLEAPRFQTLASALGLSKGSTIDGIEGLYVENVKDQTSGQSQDGKPWTRQALEVSQDGLRGWMSVFDFPDISHLRGHTINIESTVGSNKKVHGVTIDVYQNKGKLKLSNSALIDDHAEQNPPEKQAHNLEAHGVGGVYNRQEAAPARNQPQRPSQGRQSSPERQQTQPAPRQETSQPRQQSQTTVKKPIHGATVGMAINQAVGIIKETADGSLEEYYLTHDFSRDVWLIASDIVRISNHMETGHLAPTAKQRAKDQADPQQEAQPVAQLRPAREEQQTPVQEEQSCQDDMDDTEIPF